MKDLIFYPMNMKNLENLIDILETSQELNREEWIQLIQGLNPSLLTYAMKKARAVCDINYGKEIYIRALIEFSNYCKNDCYYCGIRASNKEAKRYRLDKEQILECCNFAYNKGFRTFVLQSGEDMHFNDVVLVDIIKSIKNIYPECAITLSVGEKEESSYRQYFEAGADRFLLRHESYNHLHYGQLHPKNLSPQFRQDCLKNLKKIGYQVGTGFMVGSPFQTPELLAQDMLFIKELNPHMVGIGPFIHHKDTPFKDEKSGSIELSLFMLALLRLMLPKTLLPATTALGTIEDDGREQGILAGANVVMPNVSPKNVRTAYNLYDNKISTGAESGEGLDLLIEKFKKIGYKVVSARGDSKNNGENNV